MLSLGRVLAMTWVCFWALPAMAETMSLDNGGDRFLSGGVLSETLESAGDAFVSGRTVTTYGETGGDLHVSGFDITIGTDTAEDLYAAGGTVVLRGKVAKDLTAAGFSIRTEAAAVTQGNARLFGNTLKVEGPVGGALMAMGRDVVLNASVDGDARIVAKSISFGPDARIGGALTYSAETEIAVPERVAPAERVQFQRLSAGQAWREWHHMRHDMPVLPTFAAMMFGFIVSLPFFVLLGALMLGFMPKRLERMRQTASDTPGQTVLLGVIGLSILFGLVPIAGLTIVGLPFVPIAILGIVVCWTLGYALGAYSVAMRVWAAFGGDDAPGNGARLLVFAAAITFIALLNFIPFVGWVANYTLVLLGIGAMTHMIFQSLLGNPGEALDVGMNPIDD